jgi:hypothetical protein
MYGRDAKSPDWDSFHHQKIFRKKRLCLIPITELSRDAKIKIKIDTKTKFSKKTACHDP